MAVKKNKGEGPSAFDQARAASAKKMSLARGFIQKLTKHKPTEAKLGQHPHTPSGSIIVDNLIGGNLADDGKPICPGFPRRRITEIFGPESSGKTTVALAGIREVQRMGGAALFLDFEHALDYRYAKNIGVTFDNETCSAYAPDTLEEGFKMIYVAMQIGIDIVVVDSVAAMMPEAELAKNLSDPAKVGAVAAKMAITLPKVGNWLAKFPKDDPAALGTALVLLNQERATISTGGGGHAAPEANSSGGKALKFYASVRLRTTKIKTEKVARKNPITGKVKDEPYGIVTQVKVVKDKLDGKAGQTGEIFIRYGFGVDDVFSVIEAGVANSVMRRDGSKYTFDQVSIVGRDKFRAFLLSNPEVYKALRDKVMGAILVGAKPTTDEELSEEDQLRAEMEAEGLGDGDENADPLAGIEDVSLDEAEAGDA